MVIDLTPSIVYQDNCFILDGETIVQFDLYGLSQRKIYKTYFDVGWMSYSIADMPLSMEFSQAEIDSIYRALINLHFEKEVLDD